MFKLGDRVSGSHYDDNGNEVQVEGSFLSRTDDPEEMIQDIIIRTDDGRTIYLDEQVARIAQRGPLTVAEAADFVTGTLDLDGDLYDRLYEYYTNPGHGPDAMPYGTAKARDGDPANWIEAQLTRTYAN